MNILVNNAGNMLGILKERPVLTGEIFIQDVDAIVPDRFNLLDKATGAPITQLRAGDIYGGTGEYFPNHTEGGTAHIYQLGSGSALKFGTEVLYKAYTKNQTGTFEILDTVAEKLRRHPNTLYLYLGVPGYDPEDLESSSLIDGPGLPNDFIHSLGDEDQTTIGDAGQLWGISNADVEVPRGQDILAPIDTGDLIFFSAICDKFFVIHLSRSQAELTRINPSTLVSTYLRNIIANSDDAYNYTLSDYLNTQARYFQNLDPQDGWVPVYPQDGSSGSAIETLLGDTAGNEGYIYYIPVNDEYGIPYDPDNEWTYNYSVPGNTQGDPSTFTKVETRPLTVHPGDVIIALPCNSGVMYTVVPILSALYKKVSLYDFQFENLRADEYARNQYDEHDPDDNHIVWNADETLLQILHRLGLTKADIDPVTGKIVTSQLPSYLLGGMKQLVVPAGYNIPNEITANPDITAEDIVKAILDAKKAGLGDDIDEDEDGDITPDQNYDKDILEGSYFIWKDGEYTIAADSAIFELAGTADDVDAGDSAPAHILNNGDMVIFNGTKFSIIDNTSSFISIVVGDRHIHGSPILGTTETKKTWTVFVKNEDGDWEESTSTDSVETTKVDITADGQTIKFTAEGRVVPATDLTPEYVPVVEDGVARKSQYHFTTADQLQDTLKYAEDDVGLTFTSKELTDLPFDTLPTVFQEVRLRANIEDTLVPVYGSLQGDEYVEDEWDQTFTAETGPLYLPKTGGVLATEGYVGSAIEAVLDATALAISRIPRGTETFLQTIFDYSSGDKRFADSAIAVVASENETVVEIHLDSDAGTNTHSDVKAELVAKTDVTGIDPDAPGWHANITVQHGIPVLPTAATEQPAGNILPNYSGTLLNSNSIIFCGYWEDEESDRK